MVLDFELARKYGNFGEENSNDEQPADGTGQPIKPYGLYPSQDKENGQLYIMLLLPLVGRAIFGYWPMYGILLAFKHYRVKLEIWGSPWAGMKYFNQFFLRPCFPR